MSSHIDFRTLPANVPVLCIPRVYPNITESRIRKIFDDLAMGTLERIDIVSKTNEKGEKFNRVFVHFRRWNNSDNANTARERLLNGKEIKIIYDDPWFWKISAYREAERKPLIPSGGARKATLAFDSDEEKSSRPPLNREERHHYDRRPDRSDDRRPDRRRDVSRERPRERDDRRYTTGFPVDHKPANLERKFVEPRTPSNSPPRERPVTTDSSDVTDKEGPLDINYGHVALPPPPRRRQLLSKPPLRIETEVGEVLETDKKDVVENA